MCGIMHNIPYNSGYTPVKANTEECLIQSSELFSLSTISMCEFNDILLKTFKIRVPFLQIKDGLAPVLFW